MSISNEISNAFEATDDREILTLDEGQTALPDEKLPDEGPAKIQMTQEEYSKLLAGTDSSAAITRGLEGLAQQLAPRGPVNQPLPPDTYDPAKLEEDLWKTGKAVDTISAIASRAVAQQTGQYAMGMQETEKRLLKMDPETNEIYSKYASEIEQRVQALPPQFRFQPNIYSQMYKQVVQEKQGDIIQMKAQAMSKEMIDKAVAEALAAAGITQNKSAPNQPLYQESTPGGKPPAAKRRLVLTTADVQDMKESMMDPKDPDQVEAYLSWKARRGGK